MSAEQSLATRLVATGGLMLATLMVTLDMTIANVALPHMQGSLSASQEETTWVLTSYMVATAIMTPLSGWLSMRIGRKRLFLISIVGFVGMSVLCGMATSLPEMVVFRLLQGAAGASMMPLSQAALLDMWPRHHAQAMAIWSANIMAAPILGPTLGGWLTESYSWRWVFYINLPIGIAAFATVFLALRGDHRGGQRRFDALGYTALVLFTLCLQLMLDRGPGRDWFDSAEIWTYAVIAACGLYVFVAQTATAPSPYFPRALFTDRSYTSCLLFGALISGVLFASTALLPVLMQNLMGYSATQAGVATAPRGVGSVLAFAIAPWLAGRIGPRRTMLVGWALAVWSLWNMGHFDLAMTADPIRWNGFVQSFGSGLMFNPMTVLSFATLPPALRTEAAVLSGMARNLAGAIGIALGNAFAVRRSAGAHERLAEQIVPSDPMVRWSLPDAFDGAGALSALNVEVTRQAAMIGYDAAFGYMFIALIFILPLLLLMRPPRRAARVIQAPAE